MFLSLLFIIASTESRRIASLDDLAQKKDVAELTSLCAPEITKLPVNPLKVIQGGGAYDVGRFGWHVYELKPPSGNETYAVFSTPLTSEDVGERVFEWRDGKLARYIPESDDHGWRITHHDFDIRFDVPAKRVHVVDTVAVKHTGGNGRLLLRFGSNYQVKQISSDGKPVAFNQAGGVVAVDSSELGAKMVLTYDGVVDHAGYSAAITDRELMLTNDYWYPMIARHPASYDCKITVPNGWTGVAQGNFVSKDVEGSDAVFRYSMKLPIVYFSLAAAPFAPVTTVVDGRPFTIWSLHMSPEQMKEQAELYGPILKFYNDRFAPFPFDKYGAVVTPLYGGGALEAYSFATYGTGWLPDEDAHEPSHTWWGGILNNTYLKSFWNESFAAYCEGLFQRNVPIGNVQERQEAFVTTPRYSGADEQVALSQASVDWGHIAGDLGYGKGGYVLQMLETELGTEKMFDAMHKWATAREPGSEGEWDQFEAVVGPQYKWFFDQWVDKPGDPNFTIDRVQWASSAVTGVVHFKSKPFKIHAEALLQFPDGSRKMAKFDTTEKRLDDSTYSFSIPCSSKPQLVSVDPWRRILRRISSDEAPVSVESFMNRAKRVVDSNHMEYAKTFRGGSTTTVPSDLAGVMLIGSPETMPAMKPLCEKVGFVVSGNNLTYKGTTIDLRHGAACAIVDLGEGKTCAIGLGQTRRGPSTGAARVALVDDLGRFLRGHTEPKTSGNLTYRLP